MRQAIIYRFLSHVGVFWVKFLFVFFFSFLFPRPFFSSSLPGFSDWIADGFYSSSYLRKKIQIYSSPKFHFFVRSIKHGHGPYKRKYRFLVLEKENHCIFLAEFGRASYLVHRHSSYLDYRNYLNTPHFLSGVTRKARAVVSNALHLIGIRYRWGGNSPEHGLDCSGFVKYVVDNTLGINLPRRAIEMSYLGKKIGANDLLQPGDLVFFNTRHRPYSHVGIYISSNLFAHAPSTGNKIRVDNIKNRYWSQRYNGARRLDVLAKGD